MSDNFFPEPRANARFGLILARFVAPIALVGFIIAATYGLANVGVLFSGLLCGVGWGYLLLLSWRKQGHLFSALAFLILLLGPRFFGIEKLTEPEQWQFYCLAVFAGLAPMIFLRGPISHWCHLDEEESVRSHQ